MKRTLILFAAAVIAVASVSCRNEEAKSDAPVKIIFDTDIGNDIDDAEALSLLNLYIDEGKVDLLGICLNKEGKVTADYVDLVNTFYGHPNIRMARARDNGGDGPDAEERYTAQVCAMTREDGSKLFPVTGTDYESLPDGHIFYRELLSQQPDNSVVIVSVGFLTNLARLLDTPADEFSPLTGKELVASKVKLLSIMAGRFMDDTPEFNVMINIPASKKIFNEWPGEIACLPWEIGEAVRYPVESIENDFGWTECHPLKEAYIRYSQMPYDNYMFDPTAVVYAVEGDEHFTSSGPGTVSVSDSGVTTFTPSPDGRHSYMSLTDEQAERLKNYFVSYLTRKPASFE